MPEFHVIIPARYGSERLPGKVLMPLSDRPMLAWVCDIAQASEARSVTVATDDERIQRACRTFGVEVVMTDADHASGSDRIAECAKQIGLADDALIVNLQGDEPLTPPELLTRVANALADSSQASMATLATPMLSPEEVQSPAAVKVVVDKAGLALYFSRAPIPFTRDGQLDPSDYLRHIGIYAYRNQFLQHFTQQAQSQLERQEKLEQLRALEMGARIQVAVVSDRIPAGVDTIEDHARVEALLQP